MKPVHKPVQSEGNNTLIVSIRNHQISTSDGYRYKLTPKFLYLYYYLALMRVEDPEKSGGFVWGHQIVTLPHWERPTIVNAGKDVWRHIREMERIGRNIIESAGQKTKGPFRIKYEPEEIQIDVSVSTLKDELELIHIPAKLDEKIQSRFYRFAELLLEGDIYFQRGLLPNALEFYDKAAKKAINPTESIISLLKEGRALAMQTEWERAYEIYNEILELKKQKTLNDWEEASTYTLLGWMRYRQDKLDESEEHYLKALDIIRGKKYYRIMGDIFNGLGLIRRSHGHYDEALGYYQKALEYWSLEDYFYGLQGVYFNIGHLYKLWGDKYSKEWSKKRREGFYNRAIRWVMQCISLCERMRIAYHTSQDHILLASLYRKLGKLENAVEIAGIALDLALTANNKRDTAFSYRMMGKVYAAIGKKDPALTAFYECIRYYREIGLLDRIKEIEEEIKKLTG